MNEATFICENCINEDLDEDTRIVEWLKRFGCWSVIDQNGFRLWGEA